MRMPRRPGRHDRRRDGERGGGEADDEQGEGGDEQVDHVLVAAGRSAVVGEGDDHQHETAEPGPEAGRGEPGEGQRAGTHLQRDGGHGDAEEERHQHAEDESDAEADEHLRQGAGVEQRVAAVDPLGTEQHAEHGGSDQGDQRAADEVASDDLGVARRQPRDERREGPAAGVVGHRPGGDVGDGLGGDVRGAHRRSGHYRPGIRRSEIATGARPASAPRRAT
jgi:hypothetical protein